MCIRACCESGCARVDGRFGQLKWVWLSLTAQSRDSSAGMLIRKMSVGCFKCVGSRFSMDAIACICRVLVILGDPNKIRPG